MKKITVKSALSISAVIIFLFFLLHYFCPGKETTVEIPSGSGAARVASVLKKNGIIHSELWFRAIVKFTKTGRRLMPGEYRLHRNMASEVVLYRIVNTVHKAQVIPVSIPEGWRAEQIGEILRSKGIISSSEEFDRLVREGKLEGYLFPSTYYLRKNMLPQEVINLLKYEFVRQIKPLFSKGFAEDLNERIVLTIASLVEREAVEDAERPMIAEVYLNRYRMKKRLEADPTTQYIIASLFPDSVKKYGWWKKGLTRSDLQINSPYNTYKSDGLPPGPICNPGFKSVSAVMNPTRLGYIYFASINGREHIFSHSLREHEKVVLRIRAAEQAARR